MHTIYALCDPETHAVRYVGKTVQKLSNRLKKHLREKQHNHRTNWFKSLAARGLVPEITVIEEVTEETWQEREMYWIAHYRSIGANLVNSTDGGDGGLNPSPEARRKRSESLKGRKRAPFSEEWRRKLGDANRGKKASLEHRQKISVALKGKPKSPEHCANLSKAQTGTKRKPHKRVSPSTETRKKMSDSMRGRVLSLEHRRKISESNKGRTVSPETLRKLREAAIRRSCSQEWREKISKSKIGKKRSMESRQKQSNTIKAKYRFVQPTLFEVTE